MLSACGNYGIASHLFFVFNLNRQPQCLGYLWYLSLDMQLHILAPVFVAVLEKNVKRGVVFGVFCICASILLRALTCYYYGVCHMPDVDLPVSRLSPF